jgi:hypothetical protein
MNKYNRALEYINDSIKLAEEIKHDELSVAIEYQKKANLLFKMGKIKESKEITD